MLIQQTLAQINVCDPEPFLDIISNQILKSDKVALDIGANQGRYVNVLARKFKKVYAFEPSTYNVKILKENIRLDNIEVIEAAVTDKNGETIELIESTTYATMHTIKQDFTTHFSECYANAPRISVPTVSVDFFINTISDEVGLMKIDVEGAEVEVLNGAQEFLKNSEDLTILLETHPNVNVPELFTWLKENLGFEILSFSDKHHIVYK